MPWVCIDRMYATGWAVSGHSRLDAELKLRRLGVNNPACWYRSLEVIASVLEPADKEEYRRSGIVGIGVMRALVLVYPFLRKPPRRVYYYTSGDIVVDVGPVPVERRVVKLTFYATLRRGDDGLRVYWVGPLPLGRGEVARVEDNCEIPAIDVIGKLVYESRHE